MKYRFVCPVCHQEQVIEMPISAYEAAGHFCECGAELVRDPKDFCTSYSANFDGFYAEFPSR